jgi:hypothetical protein
MEVSTISRELVQHFHHDKHAPQHPQPFLHPHAIRWIGAAAQYGTQVGHACGEQEAGFSVLEQSEAVLQLLVQTGVASNNGRSSRSSTIEDRSF